MNRSVSTDDDRPVNILAMAALDVIVAITVFFIGAALNVGNAGAIAFIQLVIGLVVMIGIARANR